MQKKNSERDQRIMARNTATTFSTWAVGTAAVPRTKVCGNTSIAAFAMPMKARPVNDGGPTEMNIPGLVSGDLTGFGVSLASSEARNSVYKAGSRNTMRRLATRSWYDFTKIAGKEALTADRSTSAYQYNYCT